MISAGAIQSVWIDSSVSYHESVLNTLAQNEYAHSFSMPFENGRAASAVSDWFADNMRSKRRISVPFVPENKLMFASGFEFRSEWKETFVKEQTYEGVFSGTMVTDECTYMNKVAAAVPYLQTEEATASLIGLANGRLACADSPAGGNRTGRHPVGRRAFTKYCVRNTARIKNIRGVFRSKGLVRRDDRHQQSFPPDGRRQRV